MQQYVKTILTIATCCVLLAACASPAQAPLPTAIATEVPTTTPAPTVAVPTAVSPTAVDAAFDRASVQASIEETLDSYAQAYNTNDLELLRGTIDPESGAFRRRVQGNFEAFQESALVTYYEPVRYKVATVEPLELGFVRAQIDSGGWVADWTFREVEGRWLLSEPLERQIGERETQESDHFTFRVYNWGDEVNADVMELMEEARSIVEEQLGKVPETKAQVDILPIFGIGAPISANVGAFYARTGNKRGLDRIVIYAPGTFSYGWYDPADGWQPSLRQTLVHEYTHLVNDRSFTPIHRLPMWMTEGLAEYVSGSSRAGEVAAAVHGSAIIPLIEASPADPTNPQDLQHMGILERDGSLAYGLSYSLVAYIAETYGGLEGFWELAAAYDESQRLPEALEAAFGVSYEQFDQGWRAWLEQKY